MEYKHVKLEIVQDENAPNPRDEFSSLSEFYGVRGRYMVGGKIDHDFAYRDSLERHINYLRKARAVIVEFTSDAGDCYAVVEREKLQKEYLQHGYSMRKALYWARQCAKGEVKEWLNWCNGDVYGYTVTDLEGNHIDSCWGYYGEEYAREEGESAAAYREAEFEKQAQQTAARLQEVSKAA